MARSGKVVLVGDTDVGKTTIIYCATHTRQSASEPLPTVKSSAYPLSVRTVLGEIQLMLWDTAGQEVYRSLVPMFTRGAEIALIVFDMSERVTFENLNTWIELFEDLTPEECERVIIGNKKDKMPWAMSISEIEEFCQERKFRFMLTSATTGDGIPDLFEEIAMTIQKRTQLPGPVSLLRQPDVAVVESQQRCC
jgi:small GTP-binding protein